MKNGIMLGSDSYHDWYNIGMSLNDGLGEKSQKYFHLVSKQSKEKSRMKRQALTSLPAGRTGATVITKK